MVLVQPAFHIATLAVAGVLLIMAAIKDAHHYRIPNILCGAMIALFPVFVITAPHAVEWEQNVMVFILVLISGLAMFFNNLAGAGDVKLLAATGLWAGPHLVAVFLVTTALAGGALALVMACLTYMRNRSARDGSRKPLPIARVPIPYGIAIAVGGLDIVYHLSAPILFPG